ncbi:phage minor tail protein G [Salmonella enterica]|nr:phage minor tail protein G [Salmonella enterica]
MWTSCAKSQLKGLKEAISVLKEIDRGYVTRAKIRAIMDGATEADKRVAYMQMALEINAWLVSRSLLNGDSSQDADTLYQSVQAQWSYEALDAGAESVLMLSGLSADKKDNASDSGNESEDMTPEKF